MLYGFSYGHGVCLREKDKKRREYRLLLPVMRFQVWMSTNVYDVMYIYIYREDQRREKKTTKASEQKCILNQKPKNNRQYRIVTPCNQFMYFIQISVHIFAYDTYDWLVGCSVLNFTRTVFFVINPKHSFSISLSPSFFARFQSLPFLFVIVSYSF